MPQITPDIKGEYRLCAVEHSPCMVASPILTNVREYVQLIAERKFEEDGFEMLKRADHLWV